MSANWRAHAARQLAGESIQERVYALPVGKTDYKIYSYSTVCIDHEPQQLRNDEEWEKLLRFLLDYITEKPYEADNYMKYLYGHMDYYIETVKGINWQSEEIHRKLLYNREIAIAEETQMKKGN
jgi:hypothetical protein